MTCPKLLLFVGLVGALELAATPREFLDEYCVVCHSEKGRTGGLSLEKIDPGNPAQGAQTWEKVIKKLHTGSMPPQGMPQPEASEVKEFLSTLESALDRAALAKPNPGRSTLHRLNRNEYANAVHDLMALDVDAASLLPPDDESYGFDNNADVLGMNPLLLERYVSASRKVSRLAVGDPGITASATTYRTRPDLSQNDRLDAMPLGTRGGIIAKHFFPLDGEYSVRVKLARNTVDVIRGLEQEHDVEVLLDGARIHLAHIGGAEDTDAVQKNPVEAAVGIEARCSAKFKVKAGPHEIAVTFLKKNSAENDMLLQPFLRTTVDPVDEVGLPHLEHMIVAGPFNPTGSGDTPSRRAIFICQPGKGMEEVACAKKIIANLAKHAYRRPVTDADVEGILSYYQSGRNKGNFETGIETSLRFILASPEFIYRFEKDPANAPEVYRLNDLELASRLSFFLWSSIPDDTLLNLAQQGKLKEPAVLEQQVRRMLADQKSERMVANFAGQWLFLRNLRNISPDVAEFPDFDDNLRVAMRRETELFFGSIVHEDRSTLELLNANYTFLNERLARHYGVKGIYGNDFRRVPVAEDARRGLLGQASVLTVTSYATRTSPVLRGKFILSNFLGTPPPEPPPNVPALKENNEGGKPKTVRERMQEHRANPACAVCHKVMDPLGFSLENFDAVGRWRVVDAGAPIDASGELLDGTAVAGPAQLRQALLNHADSFVGTLTEKLLIYALGRGLDYNDAPVVRAIVHESAKDKYRFSDLVMGIVKSNQFQMRRKQEGENRTVAAVNTK